MEHDGNSIAVVKDLSYPVTVSPYTDVLKVFGRGLAMIHSVLVGNCLFSAVHTSFRVLVVCC